MVGLAQLVSASGCGPEGRGFESHISPQKKRKAPHGPGESPSVQVSKDRQQTRRPSGHLHTGRCFLPNKALRGRKKKARPAEPIEKQNRDVAQLVARVVWDHDVAGSNPVIPTKNQPKMRFFTPLSADFYNRKFFSKTS